LLALRSFSAAFACVLRELVLAPADLVKPVDSQPAIGRNAAQSAVATIMAVNLLFMVLPFKEGWTVRRVSGQSFADRPQRNLVVCRARRDDMGIRN
jgi:hypothetical protein